MSRYCRLPRKEVGSHLDSGPFSVILNGTAPERPDAPLPFYPGRRNTLEVRAAREAPDAQVRVRTTSADRRTFTRSGRLPSGGTVEIDLGPLLVPAVYEFEAGVCYRRGYRFTITMHDPDSGTPLARYDLYQCCSGDEHAEWVRHGDLERVVYDRGWVLPGLHWSPFSEMSRSMQPAVDLRLGPRVLLDRDSVELRYRLRPGLAGVDELRARLAVHRRGAPRRVEPGTLVVGPEWATREVDVSAWEPGTYWFELLPELEGRHYAQGPRLRYRRPPADPDGVLVSPLAPFRLRRDRSRAAVEIDDWEQVTEVGRWRVEGTGVDSCLVSSEKGSSVTLQLGLRGCYAVFVQPVGRLYVQAGDGLIRLMQGERDGSAPASSMLALGPEFGPVFVCVREFSGEPIELRAENLPRAGIRTLRAVPVTEASMRSFLDQTTRLPVELRGIADWWDYFDEHSRTELDQIEMILAGQCEVGMTSLSWAIGRSCLLYHSRLPQADLFPGVPLTDEILADCPHFAAWSRMVRDHDTFGYVLSRRRHHGLRIDAWLTMNRHYSPTSYGGALTSSWARQHPEIKRYPKHTDQPDASRVEFFFAEARRERVDILAEAAALGSDGLTIGCCRQPPMAGYHPAMVAEYRRVAGVDPRTLDYTDGEPFERWLRWRCRGLTELLRELRRELGGRPGGGPPVAARVPCEGLFFNVAEGMDVERWVAEGLVDELQMDPLHDAFAHGSQDIRPYIALGRRHGVRVLGGVNGSTGVLDIGGVAGSPAAAVRRAIGLVAAGVDGIEIYESEIFAAASHYRWLVPLWGDARLASGFLRESNLESVFPIDAANALGGSDNHWSYSNSVYGTDEVPAGARDLV